MVLVGGTAQRGGGTVTAPPYEVLQREASMIARWFVEAHVDPSGTRLWELMASPAFARLWYGARSAGELLRGWALEQLYTRRSEPGGAYPDPREPAAFSARAVLSTSAMFLGAQLWPVPAALDMQAVKFNPDPSCVLCCWLLTFPDGRPPQIAYRQSVPVELLEFDMACLVGLMVKNRATLLDPQAPADRTFLPCTRPVRAILHQFAIALLALESRCPQGMGCDCEQIRVRFNAAPADHVQPTDYLSAQDIRGAIERERRATCRPTAKLEEAQWDEG